MQAAQLNTDDIKHLESKGVVLPRVHAQIQALRLDMQHTKLERACTAGDGILKFDGDEQQHFRSLFMGQQSEFEIVSFIPASGAASRMFSHLHHAELNTAQFNEFVSRRKELPFFPQWKAVLEGSGLDVNDNAIFTPQMVVETLLSENGLNFGAMPKGSIPFHAYENASRTPFEEHLWEAAMFSIGKTGSHVHFTVAPTFSTTDRLHVRDQSKKIAGHLGVKMTVSFSEQYASTDTVSLLQNGELLRDDKGCLVLRPGGHGALLKNLNELNADLIFIKNIDNVLPDRLKGEVGSSKQLLGGLIIELTAERNRLYAAIMNEESGAIDQATKFFETWFNILAVREKNTLENLLLRPIRVCGMVPNVGEPGGGPFWVKGSDGELRVQIVEKAQIDLSQAEQVGILESSTHFNPVDIVCSIRNPKGELYNLSHFVEEQTAFITKKNHQGKSITVYEHPGLWNGSMGLWNSVFVEVPLETFAPVKTVNDLFRPYHK
ncbi:MAG: DUF4301 family protein [Cryomorphaceae bacterium]|nr:DUF4301 family protein [Cryomorphaceae bacterium]